MRTAEEWFEEELSGEPLTQASVIECIGLVQAEAIIETIVGLEMYPQNLI